MQRAMAKQAEAHREKCAKISHAGGELQACRQLSQAGGMISSQPGALQLRYLPTLTEIAAGKNSTIIFPLPMDVLQPILENFRKGSERERVPNKDILEPEMSRPISNAHL